MNKPITAIIEIPAGSSFKYEQDQDDLSLMLDRSLKVTIPENYGYITNTTSDDGDALDVFILTHEPLIPLSRVRIEIVGGFTCDDNGVSDPKILAVLDDSDMDQDSIDYREEAIEEFLSNYKEGLSVKGSLTAQEAFAVYMKSKDKE